MSDQFQPSHRELSEIISTFYHPLHCVYQLSVKWKGSSKIESIFLHETILSMCTQTPPGLKDEDNSDEGFGEYDISLEIESFEGEVLNRTVYDGELGLGIGIGVAKQQEKMEKQQRLDNEQHEKQEKMEKYQLPSTRARWELREMLTRGLSIEQNSPKQEEEEVDRSI